MKKTILTLTVIFLLTQSYAQNLKSLIHGENGNSKHYALIKENEKISFAAKNIKEVLGLNDETDLVLTRTESDKLGYIHYRFYQTYQGIPVENSMYIVQTKQNLIKKLSGQILTDPAADMKTRNATKINAQNAFDIAANYVHATEYAWQNVDMEKALKIQMQNKSASYKSKPALVWYNPGEDLKTNELKLAYKVDVYALQPLSRAYYFVDAQTGNVLGKKDIINFSDAVGTANTFWSSTQTIHSDFTGSNYRLRDLTKGNGIITLHGESGQKGTDYTSASANWVLTGTNQAAMDAHYGVAATYTFYKNNFNRNSYDNAGTALTSYVNDPTYMDNAFWDGTAMNFNKRTGSNGGVTAIDICGHELTHGVTQATCNLNYSGESGAMNESLSDIMGKSVQFYTKPSDINWQLSNDMNWIIRDMSNPNSQGQPDTYQGTYWYSGILDNGGVHTNSGVGNFFFYLLVNGGSGTNDKGTLYNVTGIGLSEAQQIIYRTQTVYLVSTSKYVDWRTACVNAATDLYGAGSNEVTQVQNAWTAVGVGAGSGGNCVSAYDNSTNDGFGNSVNIPLATDIKGSISSTTDNDYYNVTVASAGTLIVTLATLPFDYDVVLYNGSQAQVGISEKAGTSNESITYSVPAAGTYYIRIYGYNGAYSTSSCYTLKATFTASGGTCPSSYDNVANGSFGNAQQIPLNTNIKGRISPSGDNDYYKFTITNGGTITVSLTTLPKDYDLRLYNGSQSQIGISQNGGTSSETINKTVSPGTYYARVYGYLGANSTTCYTLKIATGTASLNNVYSTNNRGIKLFPNPAHDVLNINIDNIKSQGTLFIYDMYSKAVITQRAIIGQIQVDVKKLPAGVYYVTIKNDKGEIIETQKFVKQ